MHHSQSPVVCRSTESAAWANHAGFVFQVGVTIVKNGCRGLSVGAEMRLAAPRSSIAQSRMSFSGVGHCQFLPTSKVLAPNVGSRAGAAGESANGMRPYFNFSSHPPTVVNVRQV